MLFDPLIPWLMQEEDREKQEKKTKNTEKQPKTPKNNQAKTTRKPFRPKTQDKTPSNEEPLSDADVGEKEMAEKKKKRNSDLQTATLVIPAHEGGEAKWPCSH